MFSLPSANQSYIPIKVTNKLVNNATSDIRSAAYPIKYQLLRKQVSPGSYRSLNSFICQLIIAVPLQNIVSVCCSLCMATQVKLDNPIHRIRFSFSFPYSGLFFKKKFHTFIPSMKRGRKRSRAKCSDDSFTEYYYIRYTHLQTRTFCFKSPLRAGLLIVLQLPLLLIVL